MNRFLLKIIVIFVKIKEKISATPSFINKYYNIGVLTKYNANFSSSTSRLVGKIHFVIGQNTKIVIEESFTCVSGPCYGIEGSYNTKLCVYDNANLYIGKHVGLTNVAIHCSKEISIGNNTIIGAGTVIADTDFHSLKWKDRMENTGIRQQQKKL